jgi:nitrite reductase (NO-forming)
METSGENGGNTRRNFIKGLGVGALAGVFSGVAGDRAWGERMSGGALAPAGPTGSSSDTATSSAPYTLTSKRVAADPTKLPPPVGRRGPQHVAVELEVREEVAEIESGVAFHYMTFGGQVPGPMLRVRQGDTVHLTLKNPSTNQNAHNVDLHAVYGTGGGNEATTVAPGQAASVEFKAAYPGAFIYHCAVPNLDYHISSGMFGMIVVEPAGGLPAVDREFYLGQNEVYLKGAAGESGLRTFDFGAMLAEDPTYVLLNGEKYALTPSRWGSLKAKRDETVRVFFVCGGPNLSSHFHPIGNVWSRAWPAGALANAPQRYIQTLTVPPGSCGVFEMELPVPETIKLVDHALSRVVSKGMLGMIDVEGAPRPGVFNPKPGPVT